MGKFKGFTSVQLKAPKMSTFDLSHDKKLSTRMGKLTPIMVAETLPGDRFTCSSEVYVKLAPMVAPIFHKVHMYVHFFFVPLRHLWIDWEDFITGGRSGETIDVPPVPPRFGVSEAQEELRDLLDTSSLSDYLGVPTFSDVPTWPNGASIDAMPFLAYQWIWENYYKDRNYTADTISDLLPSSGGLIAVGDWMDMKYRCWEHDYFTSALPWTQRGSEVLMPIEGTGSVSYLPLTVLEQTDDVPGQGSPFAAGTLVGNGVDTETSFLYGGKSGTGASGSTGRIINIDTVDVDNSSVSINDLRTAVALQHWMERNAIAGSRYTEFLMAHFAVRSSDARLQRPEYLGGGKAVIQVGEINTTAFSTDADDQVVPPANPAGRGSAYGNTNSFSYRCEEHGIVMGIMSVMPTTAYFQGMPRMFQQRNTFMQYPFPTMAQLGEQEVYDYEIYVDNTSLAEDRSLASVFGYQSRYADWKHIASSVHGDFRTSLKFWHLGREFSAAPFLGEDFVTFEDELQDRIFAVSGVDTLWCWVYNKTFVRRALPYFGTPKLVG